MDNFSNIKESDILIRYLAQETSAEEHVFVQTWLDQSPDNKEHFDQIKQLWEDTNDHSALNQKYQTTKSWNQLQGTINKLKNRPGRTYRLMRWTAIAASVLILMAIGIYFLYNNNNEIKITSNKKVLKITLPDASVVWLNRNSELIYKKSYNKDRSLKFSGEGYFEVLPNISNPFIIITKSTTIKVLGTKFNVQAYPEDSVTEVVVKSGKVMLTPQLHNNKNNKQTEIILSAGEKGIDYKNSIVPQKLPASDPNYLSWKTREFVFDNTNIKEIVSIVNNIYDVNIELKPGNTENCNLSGKFNCQSLDDILDMLRIVLNIEVEKNGEKIVINSPGC